MKKSSLLVRVLPRNKERHFHYKLCIEDSINNLCQEVSHYWTYKKMKTIVERYGDVLEIPNEFLRRIK